MGLAILNDSLSHLVSNKSRFEWNAPVIVEIYLYWCKIAAGLIIFLNLIAFILIVKKWKKVGRIHTTKYFLNIQLTHLAFAIVACLEGSRITRLEIILSNGFILVLFVTMICSNIDRYLAICHPFRYQKTATTKKTIGLIITIWIFAIIFVLNMYFQGYKRRANFLILTITTTSTLSIAMVVLTYSNIAIWLVAKRHVSCIARHSVDANTQNKEKIRRKQLRKSTLTCMLMVTSFLVFWSPFLIYLLIALSNPKIKKLNWGETLSRITIMIIHLNPISDPIIFVLLNKSLRKTIKEPWFKNPDAMDSGSAVSNTVESK
ncbi:melanocortin receptor 5-like [Clytia hemisphaerica]|uniref:melanocortin receptor 5-like n=1 Tax=Clytia hemisphaerica TaxID=252671 RepID=UPI0034D6CD88